MNVSEIDAHQPVSFKLTEPGKAYFAASYRLKHTLTAEEARDDIAVSFVRGDVYVMQVCQLERYMSDGGAGFGSLMVPGTLRSLTPSDVTALNT